MQITAWLQAKIIQILWEYTFVWIPFFFSIYTWKYIISAFKGTDKRMRFSESVV